MSLLTYDISMLPLPKTTAACQTPSIAGVRLHNFSSIMARPDRCGGVGNKNELQARQLLVFILCIVL